MNKFQFITCLLILTQVSVAQKKTEVVLVSDLKYSLPKTEVLVQLEVERKQTKPGMYYQYAERYLASDKAIITENIEYRLHSIRLVPVTVADASRTFNITPVKKSALNFLQVNNKGILIGVNNQNQLKFVERPFIPEMNRKDVHSNTTQLLPLGEEFMMAGSVAKLAEGAAKQIYRIRESRMSILTGDLEHLPADGTSVKTMLEGLDKAEKELTALFMGSTHITFDKIEFSISIDSLVNEQLAFRLSTFKGFVDKNDLSGNPYYFSVQNISGNLLVKNAEIQPNTLYTIDPVFCEISITNGVKTFAKIKTDIPQLGKLLPVSPVLLAEPNVSIIVDPTNGRLISVSK